MLNLQILKLNKQKKNDVALKSEKCYTYRNFLTQSFTPSE